MQKIKRDDEVIVLTGRDKGKRGSVTRLRDDGRLYVSGVNMVKRHTKGNPQAGQPGGIIEKEAPIQASNIAIYNNNTNKADRVGFKTLDDGKKVRVFKSTGEEIDSRKLVSERASWLSKDGRPKSSLRK
jgi:large subunit ribosomal protein L24